LCLNDFEIVGKHDRPVIAVLGGISASKHVASFPADQRLGWWEDVVGIGHAVDTTDKRGRGGHQATVARENLIRQEHGIEARGTFKDPNCGESFWRDKKKPADVNFSGSLAECKLWRQEYNKKNKTKYKITDRIP